MMHKSKKILAVCMTAALLFTAVPSAMQTWDTAADAADNSVSDAMTWGTLGISGGGFVSGIVTGQKEMYARTDGGGAYRYENGTWVQLMGSVSEADRGLLSVDGIAIDPTDDNTVYMFAGCNYFSGAKSVVFRSTDGGQTMEPVDVTDLIQTHGNGPGRQQGERICVDPTNTDVVYCGGRTGGLIKSSDAGKTWEKVKAFDDLGLFTETIKWPQWTEDLVQTTENQNGICTTYVDKNGVLYVGVSVTGVTNVYTSKDGGKTFAPLSADLPTDKYIARITPDCEGNLLMTYQGGITFNGTGGAAYRYNITTARSPTQHRESASVRSPATRTIRTSSLPPPAACGTRSSGRTAPSTGTTRTPATATGSTPPRTAARPGTCMHPVSPTPTTARSTPITSRQTAWIGSLPRRCTGRAPLSSTRPTRIRCS